MRQTREQQAAADALRRLAAKYKTSTDIEGWPIVPGRLGQLEHDGFRLAVYTDRRRLHARLLAIPGVTRHQRGDDELRAWVDPGALPAVAKLIKARRRRTTGASPEVLGKARQKAARVLLRATSEVQNRRSVRRAA